MIAYSSDMGGMSIYILHCINCDFQWKYVMFSHLVTSKVFIKVILNVIDFVW